MNVIRIKRGENILTKNITLMAGELALDTVSGVLYTSLTDNGNPVEIKGAASGTVSKAEKADYATKLETKQLIKLTGDVTGEANFDGSAAAEITATLKNIVEGATVNGITFNAKGLITGAEEVVYKVENIDGLTEALAGKVDKVEGKSLIADSEIARLANVTNYNDTEVRGLISQNATDIDNIEKAIDEIVIPTKVSDLTDAADYVTDAELEGKGYLTEVPADYVTETELTGKGYLVANDIAGKADKTELHSHTNKTILDGTTASYTTAEKEKLAGLSNYDDSALTTAIGTKANASEVYTKTEIDTTVSGLNTAINGKAAKATTLSGYGITDAYTKTEVDAKIAGTFKFMGEKDSVEALPADAKAGDVYQVGEKEYAYDGDSWVELGFNVDLTAYATTSSVDTKLADKLDTDDFNSIIADYAKTQYVNEEVAKKADATHTHATTEVTGLSDILAKKADAATVTELSSTVATKANASDLTTLQGTVNTISGKVDTNTADIAKKANSAEVYTITAADAKFQAKGNYLTEIPAEYITETELSNELKAYAKTGTTLAGYGITDGLSTSSVIDGGTF